MNGNDGVYKTVKQLLGKDGMLFDELGEVVETTGYCEGKEQESKEEAQVALTIWLWLSIAFD